MYESCGATTFHRRCGEVLLSANFEGVSFFELHILSSVSKKNGIKTKKIFLREGA